MPVRSLNSSVLKWPDPAVVVPAVRRWASDTARRHPQITRIGYFGSYARGDWGVGSDLDLLVVVSQVETPFGQRASGFDTATLPVPTELLVYTAPEWEEVHTRDDRFARMLATETTWLWPPSVYGLAVESRTG